MATSRTLLARVRDAEDRDAWTRFFGIYAPLLESYARALGLSPGDAEEVRDECLAIVARAMPDFEYRPGGGFKSWLYAVARAKVVDHLRRPRERQPATGELGLLRDPAPSPDEVWERGWRREHLRFCLDEVRRVEPERTYRVFELLLEDGLSVPEVCARTGLNANQVYKAKGRVLRRVREILDRLGTG